MNPIRWGIIGSGNIAGQFARGLSVLDDAALVAVGSRRQETADRFGDEFDVPHRHASYEDLAADPDVDIVYIATPHSLHRENTLLCLEAGKAVLCEKPFAINAAEAREMVARAREKKLLLMEAIWTRFLPHYAQTLDRVRDGAIGEIRLLECDFCFRAGKREGRLFDPALGGGALLDVGIYPVAMAYHYLGRPDHIVTRAHLGATGVDEQAVILFEYENGAQAVLTTGIRINTPHVAVIAGSGGEAMLNPRWWAPSSAILRVDGAEIEEIEPEIEGNGYQFEAAEAMRCLRDGRHESPTVPLDETLAIMELLDEIRAAWGLQYPMERNGR